MACLLLAALAALLLLSSPVLAADGLSVPPPGHEVRWVQVHRTTGLWSSPRADARLFALALPGRRFQLALPPTRSRLYVWDPLTANYAWIDAADVGPSGPPGEEPPAPRSVGTERRTEIPPERFVWRGVARVTMYSCEELGGCGYTALGPYPYEGVVAVDPYLIPLGSTVWVDGLGIFLAADTGSAVFGNRIDAFVYDYARASRWGVQYLDAAAYLAT